MLTAFKDESRALARLCAAQMSAQVERTRWRRAPRKLRGFCKELFTLFSFWLSKTKEALAGGPPSVYDLFLDTSRTST